MQRLEEDKELTSNKWDPGKEHSRQEELLISKGPKSMVRAEDTSKKVK